MSGSPVTKISSCSYTYLEDFAFVCDCCGRTVRTKTFIQLITYKRIALVCSEDCAAVKQLELL